MNYAIIVAGGSGKRMKSEVPKQFLELCGKPVLYHTIQRFLDFSNELQIILVLPANEPYNHEFMQRYFPDQQNIRVVEGGDTRFHSVQNGLQSIEGNGIVFIHDGVRPLVSQEVMQQCYKTASQQGNAIPCIELKDSLRNIHTHGNQAVSRSEFRSIQTPQTFSLQAIKAAYKQDYTEHFTDEASVFEAAGHEIHLVPGNEENIKITTPLDLELASLLICGK